MYLHIEKNLLTALLVYGLLLLNSLYLHSAPAGLIAFIVFIGVLGNWVGKTWGRNITLVNFLIGCFTLISLIIISMGIIVYLMIFSALAVWIFLALILLSCCSFDVYLKEKTAKQKQGTKNVLPYGYFLEYLRLKDIASVKFAILVVTVMCGLLVGVIGRTGESIAHVGQAVSPIFWVILVSSFVIVYLIWKEKELAPGLKLCSIFLVAFLVFGLPGLVYRNYITEDSFALLGVTRSVIETGMYGWVLSTFKTGYFALISSIAVGSSAELFLPWICKLLTPLLVSIYVPLFIYLILGRIIEKEQRFVALISLMFFPVAIFLSIPLEKNIATVFFLGVFWFSLLLLDDKRPRKADITLLGLALLATPFLHDYFALYSAIPLILSLFLRLYNPSQGKHSMFLLLMLLCFTSLLIPSSFVAESYVTGRATTTFSCSTIESIIGFWTPKFKLPESYSIQRLPYLYSDNFTWVRYVIFILGILTLIKGSVVPEHKKIKIWLVMTVLAFWLGYFLLKTATRDPPEAAKDYRFGFFVDLSLVPLAGIVIDEITGRASRLKIRLKLWRTSKRRLNTSFKLSSLVTLSLILIATVSMYSGYCFDRIMERPIKAEEYGRYVVTDDKLESMGYIRDRSGLQKSVILSDNHMAKIALGALGMRLERAELFHLNSGGELYPYFNEMRQDPNTIIMQTLMNKTNSEIGFFVIGLEDWKGWYPEGTYWIDENAIEKLKLIANDWQVFGNGSDLYVFVFEKHS